MDILRNLPVQQPAALRELISIQPGLPNDAAGFWGRREHQ